MVPLYALVFFLHCFSGGELCSAIDTITTIHPLQNPGFIVSNNGTFKLGFFNPPNTTNSYVGIWFNIASEIKVVWVANRDKPITDSSGVLKISENGNLQLLNGQNKSIWSSKVLNLTITNTSAQLLDSGNLVLLQVNTSEAKTTPQIIWLSFDHPTNVLLPGMRPAVASTPNRENVIFQSWSSPSDPSEGSFLVGIGTKGLPQVFIWNNGIPYWRSGPFDGNNFIGIGNSDTTVADGFILVENKESGTVSMSFSQVVPSLMFMVEPQGTIKEQFWDDDKGSWIVGWSAPNECDVYGTCGANGICNNAKSPICRCLRGFQPRNQEEWRKGNWSSGCVRKTPLQCGTQGGQQDGFLRLSLMKVPDNIKRLPVLLKEDCRTQCLNNCSCMAYAYHLNKGCMTWSKDLIDIQEFSAGGVDLFVRLPSSEIEAKRHKKTAIIISTVVIGTTVAVIFIYLLRRCITKRGKRVRRLKTHRHGDDISQLELQEPPLYTFDMLQTATDNFHESNKLGEGGFGPVYKGILEDGQEIGVKRLSRVSGQDNQKRELLPWEKRFNIIKGICCGLLYLHRDSRLRIIHRDLKASNILLDEEFNPKISDFGMARIFGNNQDQANTKRVVGTYGYMSPEYTMGQFSEKSDVYSFGVILLEIVSGRRNTTCHRSEHSLTLPAYAWKLWNEGNTVSLIDPIVSEPRYQAEIMRCIQVGLLCVQEVAKDRPNTSTVRSMLDSDTEHLPHPKRPPFTDWDISSDDQQSKSSSMNNYSMNSCSMSIIEARS